MYDDYTTRKDALSCPPSGSKGVPANSGVGVIQGKMMCRENSFIFLVFYRVVAVVVEKIDS